MGTSARGGGGARRPSPGLALAALVGLAAGPSPEETRERAAAPLPEVRWAALSEAAVDARRPQGRPRPESLAILILSGASSGYPLSEVYAATRRPLEAHTALRVAPLEAIGIDERDAAIRTCAGDASCFVRRLEAARSEVDLLLTVSLDRPDDSLLLGLRLIDTREAVQLGATGDEIPSGMALEGAVERRLPDIVPSTLWDQVAGVRVESDPPAAEATVAGRTCVTPCAFERLAPGMYTLVVRTSGLDPWRSELDLRPGQTPTVRARLESPDRPLYESPWLWVTVGAGLAAGIVAGALLVQRSDSGALLCISAQPEACERL